MTLQIKLAANAAELDALFRARHRVFVGEMAYVGASGDGRLVDRFDAFPGTRNVLALVDGEVVGGVRFCPLGALGTPLDSFFDFAPHLPVGGGSVAVGSQVFVEAPHRATPEILLTMMAAFHDLVREEGFGHVVGVSAPMAERHLLRSGYKPLTSRFFHEAKRLSVLPVMLDLRDLRDPGARREPAAALRLGG